MDVSLDRVMGGGWPLSLEMGYVGGKSATDMGGGLFHYKVLEVVPSFLASSGLCWLRPGRRWDESDQLPTKSQPAKQLAA